MKPLTVEMMPEKPKAENIWEAARVIFEADEPAAAADRIADIFHDLGLSGVVVETPEQEPDVDWDPGAEPPADVCAVTGYWIKDDRAGRYRSNLARALARLEKDSDIHCRVEYDTVDEEDWAESWKAHFEPERIGARTVIRPSWRAYRSVPGDVVIEIDPGMAFGTGTHPTTRLCIQLLERWIRPGARFLDVGTGSGVLMCVAAAFGAGQMTGIDNDPLAAAVAAENLRKNRVPEERFSIRTGNLLDGIEDDFDVVAANILTPVILELIDGLDRVLSPGGVVITSGVLEENAETVAARMRELGLEVLETRAWEDWAALVGRKRR
jgi:ribosomal protein L11 methyltransferase